VWWVVCLQAWFSSTISLISFSNKCHVWGVAQYNIEDVSMIAFILCHSHKYPWRIFRTYYAVSTNSMWAYTSSFSDSYPWLSKISFMITKTGKFVLPRKMMYCHHFSNSKVES
jgi:hypothetical protein